MNSACSPRSMSLGHLAAFLWVFLAATGVAAASPASMTLPDHPPMRVLIVSDEVNPHGLPPDQLTQPGEIGPALANSGVLNVSAMPESVLELPTNAIAEATIRLQRNRQDPTAYDVLIYFAHRIPDGPDGALAQEAFVAAVREFLRQGGGVVVFHHGIYRLPGKESMQTLIGGEATGAVPWNTVEGQAVINVAPGHFVTTHGISYAGTVQYADPALGIPLSTWSAFTNVPDERYPDLVLFPGPGRREILFASNYSLGDGTHVLGYTRREPDWAGTLVFYQPGEHQPQALGPGNNLQVLLNAVLFARDSLFAGTFE